MHEAGEKSALGTRKKITHRLNKLETLPKRSQPEVIDEVRELVDHLYIRYKESQRKLQEIRSVIIEKKIYRETLKGTKIRSFLFFS